MIIPILDTMIRLLVMLALLVLSCNALVLEAATPDISIQTLAPNSAESPAGIIRYPDISAKQIVFVYNSELWLVPREGGTAIPLTNVPGPYRSPKFSLDGNRVAFTGGYDGIYTINVGGASATRVTHNPGATDLCDWTPDGKLLFMTDAFSFVFNGDGQARVRQLYIVGSGGGLPVKLPVSYGADGAISPDGQWLAYTFYAEGRSEHRKHYLGGYAPDIWLFNLHTYQSKKITDWVGTDMAPMWNGTKIYYLSDAGLEQRLNIWSYDTKNGERRQITHFKDYDIKWPSIGPTVGGHGEIIFVNGADLNLLDLGTGMVRVVKVSIPDAQRDVHSRPIDAAKFINNWQVSPDGKQAVVEARGDIWTVPAENGAPRNLERTSGAAERDPSWSPDGKWIAYFSDASGEYELYVASSDGAEAPRQLTHLGVGFRYRPTWSPDSRRIAFNDSTGSIYLSSVDDGEVTKIDQDPLVKQPQLSWSSDSNWLAYARGAVGSTRFTSIWLYSVQAGQTHQVTSGSFNDSWPTFDRQGDYLFFNSARNITSLTFDTYDNNNFIYPSADILLAIPLRREIGSPWVARNNKTENSRGGSERPIVVELGDFERRATVLAPDEKGRFSNLAVTEDGQLLYSITPASGDPSIKIMNFNEGRKTNRREIRTVIGGASDFRLSANGKKLLVRKDDAFTIVDAAPDQGSGKPLSLTAMSAEIDPRAEWRQIFNDAWRFYRDFFYDSQMRGVDWTRVREKYVKLRDVCATREDLDYVIGEMAGELGNSHVFVFSTSAGQQSEGVAMLSVDFGLNHGAYRILKIYDGGITDTFARNPLRRGGVNVQEGDYLLAVNKTPIDIRQDPWAAFKGLSGKEVTLTVSAMPTIDQNAREVVVRLGSSENLLRNRTWVEANRAYVDRRTGGKVGYIYLANTHDYGSQEFTRQFNGQLDKAALIIDERWNEGGYAPFHFVDVLSRQLYLYYRDLRRSAGSGRTPDYIHQGPLCMLINGVSYSGGDLLPYFFRQRGLGKLIGTRTMGGMVGAGAQPSFVDGGVALVPHVGFSDTRGNWVVEGRGIEPDVKVIDDPGLMVDGADPQLDSAIQLMLKETRRYVGRSESPSAPRTVGPSKKRFIPR
jgi:tricorn protease